MKKNKFILIESLIIIMGVITYCVMWVDISNDLKESNKKVKELESKVVKLEIEKSKLEKTNKDLFGALLGVNSFEIEIVEENTQNNLGIN